MLGGAMVVEEGPVLAEGQEPDNGPEERWLAGGCSHCYHFVNRL